MRMQKLCGVEAMYPVRPVVDVGVDQNCRGIAAFKIRRFSLTSHAANTTRLKIQIWIIS